MIDNFSDQLNESVEIDPFVDEFFEELEDYDPEMILEEWWCSRNQEMFECYFPVKTNHRYDKAMKALIEETEERKKSREDRKITPFYLIEIRIETSRNSYVSHKYAIVGINMKDKMWMIKQADDFRDEIEQILEKLLIKLYPAKSLSRKFGL